VVVADNCSNAFLRHYFGDNDSFEGQLGFTFIAMAPEDASPGSSGCVRVSALGRGVNPSVNGGRLQRPHELRLWSEATRQLVACVTVDDSCPRDALGYAYAPLPHVVSLQAGERYCLTSMVSAGAWLCPGVCGPVFLHATLDTNVFVVVIIIIIVVVV
jgi:hypothetical protein